MSTPRPRAAPPQPQRKQTVAPGLSMTQMAQGQGNIPGLPTKDGVGVGGPAPPGVAGLPGDNSKGEAGQLEPLETRFDLSDIYGTGGDSFMYASPLDAGDLGARRFKGGSGRRDGDDDSSVASHMLTSPGASPPIHAGDHNHKHDQNGNQLGLGEGSVSPITLSLDNPQANYPGVVMDAATGLGFDPVKFDESMSDFMDPSAATTAVASQQNANAAGANIAPWLQEDEPPSPATSRYTSESTPPTESYERSSRAPSTYDDSSIKKKHHPSHFPSMPTLPRLLHRHHTSHSTGGGGTGGDDDTFTTPFGSGAASLRSSSASSLIQDAAGTATPASNKARSVRGERRETSPAPVTMPERQGSGGTSHGRFHRFGSTAAPISPNTQPDKKKGFLGNLLRRGTRQQSLAVPSTPHPDLHPVPQRSATGLGPGRPSISTSVGSSKLRHQSVSSSTSTGSSSNWQSPLQHQRNFSFRSDEVSPLEEVENEFHLNTDLDDMEGIVDPRLANMPRPSMMSVGSQPPSGSSEMGLADALHHTSSFADQGASPKAGDKPLEFQRPNPFAARSSAGSDQISSNLNQLDVSPKTSTATPIGSVPSMNALTNAPRRPSQLRNVKINSIDSQSSDSSGLGSGPIAPSWAQGIVGPGSFMFKDPFSQRPAPGSQGSPVSPSRGVGSFEAGGPPAGMAPAIAPYTPSAAAAWAAPESWGVEADEVPEEDETSSSSGSDENWTECNRSSTPVPPDKMRRDSITSIGSGSKHSHHGHHHHHHKHRQKVLHNGTTKLGASDPAASVPHFIRIYRADGSYSVMSFPLGITVAELITELAGGGDGKKATTNMKLYVRERGQDRQMLPSERPLALQARRLMQAGYTEEEHIPELGKEDWSMLCRFIYQTPVLPIINPEEESSYESFEFIDLSGRDLQTIPIFLHLHADNIIILNVSRNPMTDLPLDFIQACTSLKELRMSNMALKRVPGSIRASTTLSRLDLSCNRISDLENAHLDEISTLLSLKVQNNRLSSIPTYFLQMKALKYLNISNNTFETFPTVVCEMSNLVDLDVSFNQIAALPPQMSDLKSLERLICVGNELKEFPESFSTLANLRVLDVRRNKLVDLTPIYALPNLATLRADSNDLVTLDTMLGAKVRDFSVPHNSITRFTLAPMPGQTAAYSLTHLNLAHAKLSTLEESALADLVNLVELNLSFNQFTRLPQTLDRLASLEVFSCTDNMLASLPPNCFGKALRLRECNLHNNNLKDLPNDLWLCASIEVINLSSNLLELLPSPPSNWESATFSPQEPPRKFSTVSGVSAISGITTSSDKSRRVPPAGISLKSLFLADNRLTEDVFHQIALFSNLRVLNVSFNDIVEVPSYTLRRCDKLEQLYLSGNKLTSLPSEDLELLQNLRVLHLNGNRLQTLPSELGSIKNLEHLDVGSNVLKYNIANWPYDWNWNWNTALRYLNLSGNKRLEIKPTPGQELTHHQPNQQGHIRRELSDFTALTELRVLGLMDVTLRIPLLPDESDEKRVRTSFSNLNNMAYGISDMLGSIEHLAMFDLAVPNFRGSTNECIFGMFGRATPSVPAGKIPKYIQEHFAVVLAEQLKVLQPGEQTTEALRRTFLHINKMAYDGLALMEKRRHDSEDGYMHTGVRPRQNLHSQLRTGASGAIVYLVDKTLHVANAGDALVVVSRKGEAELLSKRHDPTDREETARIRRAEAWVSPKGLVNDEKDIDISRAFGFYQALPAVNASPEVRTRVLSEVDEFVIVGNSALWKCCSYQTAVDIARTERDDPMIAAQKLRDFAISYGAEGSVMVMVVNVSELFFGRGGRPLGSGGAALTDLGADNDYIKRAQRRKAEDVGDRTLNRLQQEIEPPIGQVAIVFTDIVNSTALWETNPGMPTAIKMHHNLMRRQLRLDGGYEVKTEGDSFMVSFQSVTAALLWAFNCQIQLLQQEWPRELLESEDGRVIYDSKGNIIHRGLRVRMGVHWGAPECERDPITRRMDYYGPMVNRAARINASADGGQLMASQDVINEIRALREYIESSDEHSLDELGPEEKREVQELRRIGGIEFKDMGERKLKGLEGKRA